MRDSTPAQREDGEAVAPTPSEVALKRLRTLGLGIIGAAVVLSALQARYVRWCALKTRVAVWLDPLDPSDGMLLAAVVDLLSATDTFAPPR